MEPMIINTTEAEDFTKVEDKISRNIYENIMNLPQDTREKRLANITPLTTTENTWLANYLFIPKELIWLVLRLNAKLNQKKPNPKQTEEDIITRYEEIKKKALLKKEVGDHDHATRNLIKNQALDMKTLTDSEDDEESDIDFGETLKNCHQHPAKISKENA